jgi:type III pantothenate kinase
MSDRSSDILIAADVGNSRIKWGCYRGGALSATARLPLGDSRAHEAQLDAWGVPAPGAAWCMASVNRAASAPFADWIVRRGFAPPLVLDRPSQLPIRVALATPQEVGIDRLLNALAANERRPQERPAVVIDCGSAITVDAVSSEGAFLGGAIAPGLSLSARALNHFTHALPLVRVFEPADPIGRSTDEAIRSGVFWGTLGGVRELVARLRDVLGGSALVYLTGGDADQLAPHLGSEIERVPELTLRGIYLAARHAAVSPTKNG